MVITQMPSFNEISSLKPRGFLALENLWLLWFRTKHQINLGKLEKNSLIHGKMLFVEFYYNFFMYGIGILRN